MRKASLGIAAAFGVALVVRAIGAPPSNGAVAVAEQATHDLGCSVSPSEVAPTKGGGYEVRACGRTTTYGCFVEEGDGIVCERDGHREDGEARRGEGPMAAGMTE